MQAVILAGGLGTRLRPLTNFIPKSMVFINNKPFLEYQLNLLKKYRVRRFLLCVGYKWEIIKEYFGRGTKLGVEIDYSIEKKLLGTGGALKKARHLLEDKFLLLNGDTHLNINYKEMSEYFCKSGKIGLLAVYKNNRNSSVGNISMDKNRFITEYRKIAQGAKLKYLDAGVGMYKKEVVRFFPAAQSFSFEQKVFPRLIAQTQFVGYLCRLPFYDIGTFSGLKNFSRSRIR